MYKVIGAILFAVFFSVGGLSPAPICLAEPNAVPQNPPIRIGVVYAFSGAAQAFSDYGRMGLELAQAEINSAGGIGGRKIELLYEDSQTNPARSVSAYRKLVAVDKVKIMIGNVWAFITNPLIPLSAADQVILISPTVMPESVEAKSDYFFSMGPGISNTREAAALFFKRNPDVKRVGVFCWEDTWGQAYRKIWREAARQNGTEIVLELCTIDFAHDYATDAARMKAAKVDAVIVPHYGKIVLQRLKEQNFSPKVLGTGNLIEDLKLRNAPPELFEGIYLTDWQPAPEFVRKFRARFGKEPLMYAHDSYEVLRSLGKALAAGGGDTRAALCRVRYRGVTGEIDFTVSSFANRAQARLYRVRDGELELVE